MNDFRRKSVELTSGVVEWAYSFDDFVYGRDNLKEKTISALRCGSSGLSTVIHSQIHYPVELSGHLPCTQTNVTKDDFKENFVTQFLFGRVAGQE